MRRPAVNVSLQSR